MTKVALYARYSTDMQSQSSIDDQLRTCRERAQREGWEVFDDYYDRAISGASMMRPGLQELMADARAGKFEVVLSEALDRVSRDQEDIAHIYKHLKFADIRFVTLSEGDIDEMHIGLKGTMNSLFLKELARKTKRGLEGRALQGKSVGGKALGYQTVKQFNGKGEVIEEERCIVAVEAEIVKRIFADFLKGKSPRKIAFELNQEKIPSPSGNGWGSSTINGNRRRGTGILNNELYIGRMVWNRLTYRKDPTTRKRISRLNPESEWVTIDLPELRIIDQETWDAVKSYQRKLDAQPTFNTKKRPPNLLSYLLVCGECGGGLSIIAERRYGCSTARNKGTCCNRTTIRQDVLEDKVIGTLRSRLMQPELTKIFCDEYTAHLNKVRMSHNAKRAQHEAELAKTQKAIDKVIESIKDGIDVSLIKDEANGLQRRKEQLTAILSTTEEAPSYIHPRMADRYATAVKELINSLDDPTHRDESSRILRELIDKIVLTPNEDRTALVVDLYGDLAGILQISQGNGRKIELKPKDELDNSLLVEIQQIQEMVDSAGTDGNCGLQAKQVQMVAGAMRRLNLTPDYGKVQLVAGVGFEPTTFRL